MVKADRPTSRDRADIEDRLAYHLRCLRKDATDLAMSSLERLADRGCRADAGLVDFLLALPESEEETS